MKKLLLICISGLLFSCFGAASQLTAQVTDIDGNTYSTVTIGDQEWMTRNLRSSRFNDGTPIPVETNNSAWAASSSAISCWYANDSAQHDIDFGRLYNGYAALNPNICPVGWSVPTVREWDEMVDFLGGPATAGGALKQVGFEYWEEPNTGATNASGFSALPTGYRSQMDGSFNYKGQRAGWFVLAPGSTLAFRWVSWSIANAGTGPISPPAGLAIRCMRPAPSTSSTENINLSAFKIYPNPVRSQLNIQLPEYLSESISELHLYDLQGRLVYQVLLSELLTQLDISYLPSSTYLLQCKKAGVILHQQKLLLLP